MTFDEALDELNQLGHPDNKAIKEIPGNSGNFEIVTLTEEQVAEADEAPLSDDEVTAILTANGGCELEKWELDAIFAENPPH